MKKIITLMFFLLTFSATQAQIVITEIMYNPPESGGDVNEFVELYNAGDIAVDMTGFSFTEGVEYTFPSFILEPNSFVLVAIDSVVLNTNFGVNAFQWTGGALNNGGEDITIVNADGIMQDSVDYDDGNGWPESPDGDGFSLVLCDYTSDNNDPANWQAASTSTGVTINDKEVFANPGADSECQASALVRFITTGESVGEDVGTVMVGVEYPAGDFTPWQVEVALDTENSTATNGMDFMFSDTTMELSGFELDTAWLEIPIIDDMLAEDTESIILKMSASNIEVHAAFNTYTIEIEDNDSTIPTYTIGEVTTVDADGIADSLGITCQIQGIVYGVNFNPNGLQFTIIDDNNDGIGLYLNTGDLGYIVQEGDEVAVIGTIGQYQGLTQIAPASIQTISNGNTLVSPAIVTALDESTESQLIKIENLSIVDPADWDNNASGFNVRVTDGTNEYSMRIDPDVNIFGTEAPSNTFNLTGIGGQYDTTVPRDEGYQILPRYLDDIEIIEATQEPWPDDVKVYPNPTTGAISIQTTDLLDRVIIRNLLGVRILDVSRVQGTEMIDLQALPAGVYNLSIVIGEQVWTQKINKI